VGVARFISCHVNIYFISYLFIILSIIWSFYHNINIVRCHILALRAGYDILAVYIGIVID